MDPVVEIAAMLISGVLGLIIGVFLAKDLLPPRMGKRLIFALVISLAVDTSALYLCFHGQMALGVLILAGQVGLSLLYGYWTRKKGIEEEKAVIDERLVTLFEKSVTFGAFVLAAFVVIADLVLASLLFMHVEVSHDLELSMFAMGTSLVILIIGYVIGREYYSRKMIQGRR